MQLKKNCFGAAKKQARKAKVAGSLAGDCAGGQPWLLQGGQTQALQELSSSGTQSKEKKRAHHGPHQGGPASSDDKRAYKRSR